MFYKIVGLSCVLASVVGAPSTTPALGVVPLEKQQPTVIPILSQSEEVESNGTYKFSYETGNGIKREESSYDKVLPKIEGRSAGGDEGNATSDEIHVQQGSYSYTAPDGTVISVRYIADENGFQPIGDHIPRVAAPTSDTAAPTTASASGKPNAPSAPSASSAPSPKSSRALISSSSSDSAAAASAPAAVASPKQASDSSKVATTEASKTTESDATSKESTTTAGSGETTTSAAESSTTSAPESSTNSAPEPSTTTAPENSSTAAPESSTTAGPEVSTTEGATTTAA